MYMTTVLFFWIIAIFINALLRAKSEWMINDSNETIFQFGWNETLAPGCSGYAIIFQVVTRLKSKIKIFW